MGFSGDVHMNEQIKWRIHICFLPHAAPGCLLWEWNTWPANEWIRVTCKQHDWKFKKQNDKTLRESKIHKSLELQAALIGHLIHSNDNPRQMTIYPIFKSVQISSLPRYLTLPYNPVMWLGGNIMTYCSLPCLMLYVLK